MADWCNCYKNRCRPRAGYAVAFGLGMTVSCFCPYGLIMFISAVIITALGIIVLK